MNWNKNKIGPEWENIPFEKNYRSEIFDFIHSRLDHRGRNGVNALIGGVALLSTGAAAKLVDSTLLNDAFDLKTAYNLMEGVGLGTALLGALVLGLSSLNPKL